MKTKTKTPSFADLCASADFNDIGLGQVAGPYVDKASPLYSRWLTTVLRLKGHDVKGYAAAHRRDVVAGRLAHHLAPVVGVVVGGCLAGAGDPMVAGLKSAGIAKAR